MKVVGDNAKSRVIFPAEYLSSSNQILGGLSHNILFPATTASMPDYIQEMYLFMSVAYSLGKEATFSSP